MLGTPELIIILVVVLIFFGGSRLPKLARSLGQASKEFKDGVSEGHKDTTDVPAQETTKGTTEP
jgi:sec-independent protein translocase protein TatA